MSKTRVPQALRDRVAAQAKHRCGYCLSHEKLMGTPMEIEHIVPEGRGGLTVEANLRQRAPAWRAMIRRGTFL